MFIRIILFYSFLVLYSPNGFAQTPRIVKLSDSLLKAGTFKAAITSYDFPEEIKTIQNKALTNLRNNPEWSHKYIVRLVERGDKDLEFLEAYGLTHDEFAKMLAGFRKRKRPIYSDTSQIIIKKDNGLITFQCSKKILLFNFLTIDTKNNIVYFDNLKVTREVEMDLPWYAPGLQGFESFWSTKVSSLKHRNDIGSFSFMAGISIGDTRPTICLGYRKPTAQAEEWPSFLVITIL